jgi:membrane protein DedA with SNARE-associated domain
VTQWFAHVEDVLVHAAGEPWAMAVVFGLIVADAFLVVIPSETVVVALGALALSTGTPSLAVLLLVAAAGAITGDTLCYLLGRATKRMRPPQWKPLVRALDRADTLLATRAATLIITARYIPFARIAVNLTAGARGFPYRRFLPLSAMAGAGWACVTALSGAAVGAIVGDAPLIAVGVSIVIAFAVGFGVDAITARFTATHPPREPVSGVR